MLDPRRGAALCLALLAGCASPPDHAQQVAAIQADIQQTFDGDVGALIYHGYEAARLAREADAARDQLANLPPYSPADINISDGANEMADQAAEERRQAEAALNRILDPLRERIAKLEQAQGKVQSASAGVPTKAGPAAVTAELRFAAGSAVLPADEGVKLKAIAGYLASHPSSQVRITGWQDNTDGNVSGSRLAYERASASYAALGAWGLPNETRIVIAIDSPRTDASRRQVKIEVDTGG